jgi:hypothetical protein
LAEGKRLAKYIHDKNPVLYGARKTEYVSLSYTKNCGHTLLKTRTNIKLRYQKQREITKKPQQISSSRAQMHVKIWEPWNNKMHNMNIKNRKMSKT